MDDLEREGRRRNSEGTAKVDRCETSERVIACALKVHTRLGPGLLEAAYEECLCHAMAKAGIAFKRQVPVPVTFDGVKLDCGFRLDLVVEGSVVVEVKAVERLLPLHHAQLVTYLRFSGITTGLLLNFNVAHLRQGIRRRVITSY